jgi:parvulin-like peptidyl-prolyl isomerase
MELKISRTLIGAILTVLSSWAFSPDCCAVTDRIVAVANSEVITLYELNSNFEPYKKKIESTYNGTDKEKVIAESRLNFLKQMTDNILIDQEAKKKGLTVRDEEVNDAIKDILIHKKMKTEDMEQALKAEGSSLEGYKKELKSHLTQMKLLRREVRSKISISEQEIGEYYKNHINEYEGKEAVRIKQIIILFPKDADVITKAAIRLQMEEVLKRLKSGEPFDVLASQFSQGPDAARGGDVGFIEKGLMLSEVEQAAFSIKAGEISGIIESSAGYHIIQVIDHRGAGIKPIESVREEILSRIEEQKLEKKFEEWMADLRKRSHIDIKL